MKYHRFGSISEKNLRGVHPDLVRVVRHALDISPVDIRVIEGLREMERQRQLVRNGSSQTLRSRHLTGHAVDLAPIINKSIPWQDWQLFELVSLAMKRAAEELSVPIIWGGDWKMRDGPHYELCRDSYP